MNMKERLISTLGLFASSTTLVCCALPALFVSLGLGAGLVTTLQIFPQLIWFSENKLITFGVSGVLLAGNGWLLARSRNAPCPIDPKLREACIMARKWNARIYFSSLGLYFIGFSTAFLLA